MAGDDHGAASFSRQDDLRDVRAATDSRTWLKVKVYLNNQQVDFTLPDGTNLSDKIFVSGDRGYERSDFSTWPGSGREVERTKRDAEVGACNETYDALRAWAARGTNRASVERIRIEFVTVNGTCNSCKQRLDRLRSKLADKFPGTKSSRGHRRVTIDPVWPVENRHGRELPPVVPGADQRGPALTAYGFAPPQAQLRLSGAAFDNGMTGNAAMFYQARVDDRTVGMVDPRSVDGTPGVRQVGGFADDYRPTIDRGSPSDSLATESADPWQQDSRRNTLVGEINTIGRDGVARPQWVAIDPSLGANKAIPLADFDKKWPTGFVSSTEHLPMPTSVAGPSRDNRPTPVQNPGEGQARNQRR